MMVQTVHVLWLLLIPRRLVTLVRGDPWQEAGVRWATESRQYRVSPTPVRPAATCLVLKVSTPHPVRLLLHPTGF